jgi:hypothetical protein
MTELQDIARQRLHSQRLSRSDCAAPADVVRWFGAVQAQDYRGSLYAIGLRMPAATEQSVEQAIADGTIIRTWPMRGTIHLVPAEDVRWMLKLLARRQTVRFGSEYRKAGLTEEDFARGRKVLTKALRGGKQLTRGELYPALDAAGIDTSVGQRGLHMLGYWSQMGLTCLGPRRAKQATFVLLEEWVPRSRVLEGEEALAELTERYFISHGPATIQDFAWWSGLSMTEVRSGLQAVRSHLTAVTHEGDTYWLAADSRPPTSRLTLAHLLPPYDEFGVAYKDRSALVDPAIAKQVLSGLGASLIVDGRMVGMWKRTRQKDSVSVQFDIFARIGRKERKALAKAAGRYAAFLGVPLALEGG